MFAQFAYESFYGYLGLYFHEKSIEIITSQKVLLGILAITFSAVLLTITFKYFKRYMPQAIIGKQSKAGIGTFIKIIACFFLGVSLLKIGSYSDIQNYKNQSWHESNYIKHYLPDAKKEFRVSLIFDFMSRSAEELSRLASIIVDELFKKTNSELEAPSSFYKAILYAGSVSIDDPNLRSSIDFYTNHCFEDILPLIGKTKQTARLNEFFNASRLIDRELESIPIDSENSKVKNCLNMKNKVIHDLHEYTNINIVPSFMKVSSHILNVKLNAQRTIMSNLLVNHYMSKSSSWALGVQKGAELPSPIGKIALNLKYIFSIDGVFHFFSKITGTPSQEGSFLAAKRAKKFSEYLKRAPHIKGMVKLFLIALFPWLIFFIFAGKWKIIISWWVVYFSVLLWTPIWVLLYNLMTSIALSVETMQAFGELNNSISLYSANLISNRLYQFYAIYSWLQVLLGPLPTILLGWKMFTSFLKDTEDESLPSEATEAVHTGASVVAKVPK